LGQLLYHATPYLSYGALAVVYVLVGPGGSWFVRLPAGWQRSQAVAAVEVAHLIGLATLVLSQGIVEYAIRSFWHTIRAAQMHAVIGNPRETSAAIHCFLRRNESMLLLGQGGIALALGALTIWLWPVVKQTLWLGPLVPQLVLPTLVGYSLLAWGLFGCGFLVTLAYPWLAARALLIAMTIQIASSLLLGQAGTFETVTLGTVVGGASLVILTRWSIADLLQQSDYQLYQAF
jgi:hypothetical protein